MALLFISSPTDDAHQPTMLNEGIRLGTTFLLRLILDSPYAIHTFLPLLS